MSVVRVMTYNILLGGRRGAPLHELVRTVAPDVLLVNEAPKRPFLSRRDCRRLARLWGLRYVAGGRSAGSNMLLVRGPVEVRWARTEVLPQPLFQPRRGLVVAELRTHGRLLGVVSCHLSLDPNRRRREVAEVLRQAATLRGTVVVAGDLNEPPHGPAWQELVGHGYADHGARTWRTFPADAPRARIDALLVRGPATVLSHGDPGAPVGLQVLASDHRGVLASLEI